MNFKYFQGCLNIDQAKKVFKTKAVELHPDTSGKSGEEFKVLNSEYQYIKQYHPFPIQERKVNSYTRSSFGSKAYDVKLDDESSKKLKVDGLITLMNVGKIKKGAVWLLFFDYCKDNNYKIKESNIKYIANKLGYEAGWVYYTKLKCEGESMFSK